MFTFYFLKRTQVSSTLLAPIMQQNFISYEHHATHYILRPYNFHMLKCITFYKPVPISSTLQALAVTFVRRF